MKKFLIILCVLSIGLLNACSTIKVVGNPAPVSQPTSVNDQVATRVSQILTVAATQNIKPVVETILPKGEIGGEVNTEAPTNTPTEAPTATQMPSPTETPAPTQTPTPAKSPEQTATTIPTVMSNITPIPVSTDDPRSHLGPPTSGDAMDNAGQWNWPTGYDQYTSASWQDGYMRITALTSTTGWRLPSVGPFQNVYIEMTARPEMCTGLDNYGIYFNVPNFRYPVQGYWFVVSCDGSYRLAKWNGYAPDKETRYNALINWTASSQIRKGPGQPNRLGVLVRGDTISLYANGYLLASYRDTLFNKFATCAHESGYLAPNGNYWQNNGTPYYQPDPNISYPCNGEGLAYNTYFSGGYFGVTVNAKNSPQFSVDVDEMAYWNNPQ